MVRELLKAKNTLWSRAVRNNLYRTAMQAIWRRRTTSLSSREALKGSSLAACGFRT